MTAAAEHPSGPQRLCGTLHKPSASLFDADLSGGHGLLPVLEETFQGVGKLFGMAQIHTRRVGLIWHMAMSESGGTAGLLGNQLKEDIGSP